MIWKPDTCGCELEYDGGNDPAKLTRVIRRCPDHASPEDAYTDNVLKNQAVCKVAEVLAGKGVTAEELAWAFDGARKVAVLVPARIAMTPAERTTLLAELAKISPRIDLT